MACYASEGFSKKGLLGISVAMLPGDLIGSEGPRQLSPSALAMWGAGLYFLAHLTWSLKPREGQELGGGAEPFPAELLLAQKDVSSMGGPHRVCLILCPQGYLLVPGLKDVGANW